MASEKNTALTLFISEARSLSKTELNKIWIREKGLLKNQFNLNSSKVLSLIYLSLNNINIDPMNFVKAIGQDDINTKKAGYLGLSLTKNDKLLILTVNTIIKDLKNIHLRSTVLRFLSNLNIKDEAFSNIATFICISNNLDRNILLNIIARHKLIESEYYNIIGNTTKVLYVKLQIICDKMINNKPYDLNENDILYLINIYPTVKCGYLKTKLVQIYKCLYNTNKLEIHDFFRRKLEEDIISPKDTFMPSVYIGLSVEICDFFLLSKQESSKVEYFIFRLINSKNPNSKITGLKIAARYGILADKALDTIIKTGSINEFMRKTFLKLINKSNYLEIYDRRKEIIYYMDKNRIHQELVDAYFYKVLQKILEHASDKIYLKIFHENPELCFYQEISRKLSSNLKMNLFEEIKDKENIKYYLLIYNVMDKKLEYSGHLEDIFANHLRNICQEMSDRHRYILKQLIYKFCMFSNLEYFRNKLYEKYLEFKDNNMYSKIILNGITLMNARCKQKLLHVFKEFFLKYEISDSTLIIENNFELKQVCSKGGNISHSKEGDKYIIQFTAERSLNITIGLNGEQYTKEIYLMK